MRDNKRTPTDVCGEANLLREICVLISFYKTLYLSCVNSLRNWRDCLSARSKFWRQSRDPKKGVRTSGLRLSWRPRRQISLSNYAISPATQAIVLMLSHYVFLFLFFFFFSKLSWTEISVIPNRTFSYMTNLKTL